MSDTNITDWDDAYANAAHIPGAEGFIARWAQDAEAFRRTWSASELDISYGDTDRQKFDLFFPNKASKGLVVFVHGGYWLRFDKNHWSQFSRGALAHDFTVCLPSYDLSPAVRIADITRQIGAAVTIAAERVEGPIRLAGHSAGGHLVTRMICDDTQLSSDLLGRVEAVVSISGLHDLRPLRNTKMNASFNLSEEDAVAESAALRQPVSDCPVTAWVGAAERPEFIRQSRVLSEAWTNAVFHLDEGKHHFNVIDGLRSEDSALTNALVAS